MRRLTTVLVAALMVVGTVAAVPAAGAQLGGAVADATVQEDEDTNETDGNESEVAPGERLAGVVGVQEAELDGEMEARSFGLAVARAESDEARAALIAAKVNESGQDLEELREQREQLREARENGSMGEGEYRARMAELGARSQNVERMANETENASQGLPEDLLREKGVNVTAIQTLREQVRDLSGGEVAEIARSIAGPAAGERPEQARERGGPAGEGAGDATERGQPTEMPSDGDGQADGDGPGNADAQNGTDAPDGQTPTEQDGSDSAGTTDGSGGETTDGAGSDSDAGNAGGQ